MFGGRDSITQSHTEGKAAPNNSESAIIELLGDRVNSLGP